MIPMQDTSVHLTFQFFSHFFSFQAPINYCQITQDSLTWSRLDRVQNLAVRNPNELCIKTNQIVTSKIKVIKNFSIRVGGNKTVYPYVAWCCASYRKWPWYICREAWTQASWRTFSHADSPRNSCEIDWHRFSCRWSDFSCTNSRSFSFPSRLRPATTLQPRGRGNSDRSRITFSTTFAANACQEAEAAEAASSMVPNNSPFFHFF